jgi:hypothetical protein
VVLVVGVVVVVVVAAVVVDVVALVVVVDVAAEMSEVGFDVATAEPFLLVAVTDTRSSVPTSVAPSSRV